jgi:hypothetical protein
MSSCGRLELTKGPGEKVATEKLRNEVSLVDPIDNGMRRLKKLKSKARLFGLASRK